MEVAPLRHLIESFIVDTAASADADTRYRRPLVGYADASDPNWRRLREIAEPTHLLPTELLPGARTVVAFFLPFCDEVVRANRAQEETAREWAVAYLETNRLINKIVEELTQKLKEKGVRAASQPATHNWDPVTISSRWSHKSAAAIAGLGSFGLHRMLITDQGCAGRCGSLAIDAHVDPTSGPQPDRCLFFARGSCSYCVDACPVSALRAAGPTEMNLAKDRCRARLDEVQAALGADACGRCAVGPCALGSAVRIQE
jgi:epoxyqueuosine reductase QueG